MKKEEKTLFEKMYETGEERFSRFAKEIVTHPALSSMMEKALRNAVETKGKMDRNVDQFLNLLNIPSKSDYNKLLAKVETLQGSLVNLNIKFDRLLASLERPRRSPRRKGKPSTATQILGKESPSS
jgi:uncharacterized iron-regulated protein